MPSHFETEGTGNRFHVLVVDDNVVALERVRRVLNGAGYSVSGCSSPSVIESAILGLEPDVVLIDVLMPGFGKTDLERLLRHHPAGSTSPVILHSAVPISTLRRMVKVSAALGIVRATPNDAEFLKAFASFIQHLQLRDKLRIPATSGLHRISSHAHDEMPEDEITQDGSTRRR